MTVYYCENCNIQTTEKRCPRCGKRHLREVRDDDFCFCCQMYAEPAEGLKKHLETQNIGCALIPYDTGLHTHQARSAEYALVFVQYKGLAYVADLFAQQAKEETQKLKQEIISHLDDLFIFEKDAEKIIKQLKLPKDTDVVEFAKSIILSSIKGEDAGTISWDEDDIAYFNYEVRLHGHYYHLADDQYEVWFNSASMRVYKIKKVK